MRILFTILILLVILPIKGYTETHSINQEIDLSTTPSETLFELKNMKPGDSVSRYLEVSNKGNKDFKYIISNNFISGDRVFYNQLDLTIKSQSKILYQGKLNKFNELTPRTLESNQKDSLEFFIKIPMELGNEFQKLGSEFEFKIYVEGTLGGVLPVDNKLPTTGSEMFNLLAIGAAILLTGLVLFTYVKRKKLDTKRP